MGAPCRHLRTKKQFLAPEPARTAEFDPVDLPPSVAHYWCRKTLGPLGPDGEPALPEACERGRACHEPPPVAT